MRSIAVKLPMSGRGKLCLSVWLLSTLAITPVGEGTEPIDPLPAPDYSFDLASWAVAEGHVNARDVLILDLPFPATLLEGEDLGLFDPLDDLDALSADNADVTPDVTFALLFSVDMESTGAVPPDPAFIERKVPYNVMDQAGLGQVSGDQFMSAQLYTVQGPAGVFMSNNVLSRNNYDEGGTDFSAQPATAAWEIAADGPRDIVSATALLAREGEQVVNVFLSATADSPSLELMPTYSIPSGADIYINQQPGYTSTVLYADYKQLQLVQEDDIDALIVFDTNHSQCFDEGDTVLFSLAPGSPSLDTITDASPQGAAADVYVARYEQPPAVFAAAADLGLGALPDNIDALDYFFCDDILACAAVHGIRAPLGDLNNDGCVDQVDLGILLADWGCTGGACLGDCDGDGDTDQADLGMLLGHWGEGCL